MVKGRVSPDDPDLAGYWRYRRDKHGTPLDIGAMNLLSRRRGWPAVRGPALDTWPPARFPRGMAQRWLEVAQRSIEGHPARPASSPAPASRNIPDTRLLLAGADRPAAQEPGTATRNAHGACLSRVPRRVARTVLRGPGPQQCAPATRRSLLTEQRPQFVQFRGPFPVCAGTVAFMIPRAGWRETRGAGGGRAGRLVATGDGMSLTS